ncbi:hypothetical protein [uncultured Shimia sp.]|uniref:COG4223 family protein n=1 Tax=uncultured Shimia sp. TaxID=573152 RepID=UPI0026295049|nr:hypothetical protein [uncultured Shimia sp.]
MAKSDKTDKPDSAQTETKPDAEEVLDAEVVEESASEEIEEPTDAGADNVVEEEGVGGPLDEDIQSDDEAPKPEAVEVTEEKSSGNGFMPMVIGGVVAAGVGFGAASYLGSQGILFGGKSDEAIAALTQKLDAQQDALATLQSNQEQISSAAGAASDGLALVDETNARVAALSDRIEELGGKIQSLEGRVIEMEKRPMTEGVSSTAIEAYEREVEQLRAMVSEQLAEAETLKENSARTAQETLAQAALTRVVSAVDSGAPYRGALTELASVSGVSIPAALSTYADDGVPTNVALADAFPDYARVALADARKQEGDGGNRLTHFLKTQLGARSTEPQEGEDADAILSRAEAALREGHLSAALDELSMLPESSQSLMADWRTMAETRLAATQAVDALAQSLNTN